jgi:phage antirepressor YoqD-like protein
MTANDGFTPTTTDLTTHFDKELAKPATMSSREIADLTGKEHDNVRRDVRNLAAALSLTFEEKTEASTGGRPSKVYLLAKRECLILVSGYSVELRARIIDRWQQLEEAQQFDPMRTLNDPAAMRGILLSYTEKVLELQGEVEEMRPQVQALERIALSEGSLCITDAAKTLQVQPKALFSFLRSHGWIFSPHGSRGDVAYQSKLQQGLLEHKTTTVHRSDGSEKTVTQVRVTPKGLTRLAKELPPVAQAA